MIRDDESNIVGWCAYCKDPIYEDEDFRHVNGFYYHEFCYRQMNEIYDKKYYDYLDENEIEGE